MIIRFKYGFEHKGFLYGWNKKELYRLPIFKSNRSYSIKKMNLIKIGKQKGYRLCSDKKTLKQLELLTERINYNHVININEDTPFNF